MAHKIIWSPAALTDVDEIGKFIARDSLRYANATVRQIFEAVEPLAKVPHIGRVIPERKDDRYREVIVRSYRILYKLDVSTIKVLGVIHGARRFESAAGGRLPRKSRRRK